MQPLLGHLGSVLDSKRAAPPQICHVSPWLGARSRLPWRSIRVPVRRKVPSGVVTAVAATFTDTAIVSGYMRAVRSTPPSAPRSTSVSAFSSTTAAESTATDASSRRLYGVSAPDHSDCILEQGYLQYDGLQRQSQSTLSNRL